MVISFFLYITRPNCEIMLPDLDKISLPRGTGLAKIPICAMPLFIIFIWIILILHSNYEALLRGKRIRTYLVTNELFWTYLLGSAISSAFGIGQGNSFGQAV